jgi:putative MFS transporter
MIVLGIAFAASTTLAPLVLFGILFNLMGAVFASALQVYSTELFPTDLRSSATAFAWGIGRAMSALVPICLLPLLTIYGLATMMAAIISTLLACLVLFALDRTPSLTRKSIL